MAHNNPSLSPRDLEDAFIKVTFEEDGFAHGQAAAADPMFDPWIDQGAPPPRALLTATEPPAHARSVQQVRRAPRLRVRRAPAPEQPQCPNIHLFPRSARQLRKLYPNHSVVLVNDYTVNLLGFPGAVAQPLSPPDLVTNVVFIPLARHMSRVPGVLVDQISFGSFRLAWDVSAPRPPTLTPAGPPLTAASSAR